MKWTSSRMDNAGIQQFQRKLEGTRDEALCFLNRVEDEWRALDSDNPQDFGDRCVTSSSQEFLFQRGSQKRQLLQMIDAALRRIHEGTYGQCIACEDKVNRKRLEAMPWTQYCLQCQETLEQARDSNFIPATPLNRAHASK